MAGVVVRGSGNGLRVGLLMECRGGGKEKERKEMREGREKGRKREKRKGK